MREYCCWARQSAKLNGESAEWGPVSQGGLRTGCLAAKEDESQNVVETVPQSFSAGEGTGDADEPGWRIRCERTAHRILRCVSYGELR